MSFEGKSMLVSAETFDKTSEEDQKRLAAYLTPKFDKVIVVVFYRRFFEWKISIFNEVHKDRKFGEHVQNKWETSIVDHIERLYEEGKFSVVEHEGRQILKKGTMNTHSLVDRLRKNFENIRVVNMHDGKENDEEFFCEVIPNAKLTCDAVKKKNDERGKGTVLNKSRDLIWGDLAYNAMKQEMVQIQNEDQMQAVREAIENHQLETLGLTTYDFPLICPSSEALDQVLSVSLMMEESLYPEFYKTPLGEESLRASFKKYSTTKLCAINADEALRDAVWIDFFKNFSYN